MNIIHWNISKKSHPMYAIRKHEDELFKHLTELEEKSKFVDWNKRERQEHFGLIAKKIRGERKIKGGGIPLL